MLAHEASQSASSRAGMGSGASNPQQRKPFFEYEGAPSLARRALAEGVATAGLTIAVVLAARAISLGDLRPLALGLGVPATVAALTLSFGPATGGHFNPLITVSQWLRGHRDVRCLLAYVAGQFGGALIGAGLATLLVAPAPVTTPVPVSLVISSEVFASAGLVTIVLAGSLVMRPHVALLAVVGWLVMINLAAPAGPFANPVLAVATPFVLGSLDTPLVLVRVAAELFGTVVALLVIAVTYPGSARARRL
jgi:glycerol uptake facilitator-like aquaporin